jgi:hypothetical protein
MLSGALTCFSAAGFAGTVHYQSMPDAPAVAPAYLSLPAVTSAPVVQPLVASTAAKPTPTKTTQAKKKSAAKTTTETAKPTKKSSSSFGGVKAHVAAVGNFLKSEFGLSDISGKAPRPDNPNSDHPRGLALDLMVPDKKTGNRLNECVLRHKDEWGVKYTIWQEPEHYNHVHISFLADADMPSNLSC